MGMHITIADPLHNLPMFPHPQKTRCRGQYISHVSAIHFSQPAGLTIGNIGTTEPTIAAGIVCKVLLVIILRIVEHG
jgi:hypothetical protein